MIARVNYLAVTPVRDEFEHVRQTLDAITNQTVGPLRWTIVDDGSNDSTGPLLELAAVHSRAWRGRNVHAAMLLAT